MDEAEQQMQKEVNEGMPEMTQAQNTAAAAEQELPQAASPQQQETPEMREPQMMKIESVQELGGMRNLDEDRLSPTNLDLGPSPPASQVDIRIKMAQE